MENFPNIMNYNFTADVEKKFDDIAEGKTEWTNWMKDFDKGFEPEVKEVLEARNQHKAGERNLGNDPKTGKPVFVKIGRFGPVVQIGSAEDKDKPQFAQLPSDKSIETITLEEALELFKLPRELGDYESITVTVGSGRYGPYILHNRKYVSIPKEDDPLTITLDRAIELIKEKREAEEKRHLKVSMRTIRWKFSMASMVHTLLTTARITAFQRQNMRVQRSLHTRSVWKLSKLLQNQRLEAERNHKHASLT